MRYLKKFGFLKGLAEGLRIDEQTPEGRVILAMIDLFEEITDTMSDLKNAHDGLRHEVGDVTRELEQLEDSVNDLDEFLKNFSKNFSQMLSSLPDNKPNPNEEEETFYEVKCPKCGEEITLNENMLDEGSIHCPKCQGLLEFDMSFTDPDGEKQ